MRGFTQVQADVAAMADYWGSRKIGWRTRAADEFGRLVAPATYYLEEPSFNDIQMTNMAFTEWVLFERELCRGRTPLQLYIDNPPKGVGEDAVDRLVQVERTQFFSRFSILAKHPDRGVATLRDERSGQVYETLDSFLCSMPTWRDGTISERLGLVDGVWQTVGQVKLYDRAPPGEVTPPGPGEVDGEDKRLRPEFAKMGFYLRLLCDTMGVDGRYASGMRVRECETPADDAA